MYNYLRNRFTLQLINQLASRIPASVKVKHFSEWLYWQLRKWKEGELKGNHYEFFFTQYFGFSKEDYFGKKILDIGCGPRGSLGWADGTAQRVGLDPLADRYLKMGAASHKMEYVNGNAEAIPFPEDYFDVVSSFNSLDHVDDLGKSMAEIKRVLASGGHFLLISDIHDKPTITEPAAFSWQIVKEFAPEFELLWEKHYEGHMLYKSIRRGIAFDHSDLSSRYGVLCALFQKKKT